MPSVHRSVSGILALALGVLFAGTCFGVPQDETEREIKRQYEAFAGKRPAKATVRRSNQDRTPQTIGVTAWRLNPVENRKLTYGSAFAGWTAERLTSKSKLAVGDRVRFTIEVPREGYVYVVSREQYADGSYGEPSLIFPATRIRNGNNRVEPGALIGIPSLEDNPPCFTLERSRPDHVAEAVSIFITPEPVANVAIGPDGATLSEVQFAQWKQFEAATSRLEARQTARTGYSAVELAVERAHGTRKLKQGDPLPQSLYQTSGRDNRMFVTIPIAIGEK